MNTTEADLDRFSMWFDIFGVDYLTWDRNKKKRMKKAYAKEGSLDCCKTTACPPDPVKREFPDWDWYDGRTTEKENAMNSAAHMSINAPAPLTEANVDAYKREHLSYRLHNIYYAKDLAAEAKFGLVDSSAPKTPKELVERVKAGLFVFTRPDKSDDEETWEYNSPWRGLRWRDPSVMEDRAGYKAVSDTLQAEKTKLNDSIMIKDPLEALAELQAWEAA